MNEMLNKHLIYVTCDAMPGLTTLGLIIFPRDSILALSYSYPQI